MDLCVLPQTGVDGMIWLLIAAIAVSAIVLGAVVLRSGGTTRRGIVTGIGALALVGTLALGTLATAPQASADAGADCVAQAPAPAASQQPVPSSPAATTPAPTTPAPTTPPTTPPTEQPEPEPTAVVPVAPSALVQCGAEPAIAVPTVTGVAYAESREGTTATITATALPGYVIADGAQTVFTFDVTPTEAAPWPVVLPEVVGVGLNPFNGQYVPADADLVPALQAAQDAGDVAYAIDSSGATVIVEIAVVDPNGEGSFVDTFSAPYPAVLSYDFARDQYVFASGDAEGLAAVNAAFQARIDQLQDENPGASVQPDPFSQRVDGIVLTASYEPGPGCETADARVPIAIAVSAPPV